MQPFEAQVIDSRHLELGRPIELPPGSKVLITVMPAEGEAEALSWYFLAGQGLEAAYGQDEPDYPLSMIKETNPGYEA